MSHDPDYIIPFGKYRGRTVENCPSSYLGWLINNVENDDMLVDNAEGEYAWRSDHGEHFEGDD